MFRSILIAFLVLTQSIVFAGSSSQETHKKNLCVSKNVNSKDYRCYNNEKPQKQGQKKSDGSKSSSKINSKSQRYYRISSIDRTAINHFSYFVRSELFIEPQMNPQYARNIGVLVCSNYMNLKNSFDQSRNLLKFAKKINPLSTQEFMKFIRKKSNLTPTERDLFLTLTFLSTAVQEPRSKIIKEERRKGCF